MANLFQPHLFRIAALPPREMHRCRRRGRFSSGFDDGSSWDAIWGSVFKRVLVFVSEDNDEASIVFGASCMIFASSCDANALIDLGLPGAVSPFWLIASAQVLEQDGQTEVICNEDGPDEWRLTWTKIDVANCHVG